MPTGYTREVSTNPQVTKEAMMQVCMDDSHFGASLQSVGSDRLRAAQWKDNADCPECKGEGELDDDTD